jgi:hypothetical protein
MTDNARVQLHSLLSTELDAAQLRCAKRVTEVESLAASKGAFNSGARIMMTAECLNEGIVQYRQFILEKWSAYVRPRLSSLPYDEQSAFVDLALEAMDKAIAGALRLFDTRSKPHIQSATPLSEPIIETGARERRSLEVELRLYMSTPTNTSAGMNVNVTTHGPGSPVNVGSGTLNQQIKTAEGMAELVAALGSLLDAMSQMQDRLELNEVREIVVEAKDEAAKPVPNKLKLRSILAGVKDGLQGVAAVQPAWDVVHRMIQMLGLVL